MIAAMGKTDVDFLADLMNSKFQDQQEHIIELKELLKKQNGRIGRLERWRDKMMVYGSLIIGLLAIVWPLVLPTLQEMVKQSVM